MASRYAVIRGCGTRAGTRTGTCAGTRAGWLRRDAVFYVPGHNASGDANTLVRTLQQEPRDRMAADVIEM